MKIFNIIIILLFIILLPLSFLAGYLVRSYNQDNPVQENLVTTPNSELETFMEGNYVYKKIDNNLVYPGGTNTNRLSQGDKGDLDEYGIGGYAILNDNGIYRMYYTGFGGENNSKRRILYAESIDGVEWNKDENRIIIDIGGDFSSLANPTVLKDGDLYKMWFVNERTTGGWDMYMATSEDALNWKVVDSTQPEKSNSTNTNGRIGSGAEGTGDLRAILELSAVKVGDQIYMYYIGFNNVVNNMYLATSSDGGYTWNKVNNSVPLSSNQFSTNGRLSVGQEGSGDDFSIRDPEVYFSNDKFLLIYTGGDNAVSQLFCATSNDGLVWEKVDNSNVSDAHTSLCRMTLGDTFSADSFNIGKPRLFVDENGFPTKLFYLGRGIQENTQFNIPTILSADIFVSFEK